MTPSPFQGWTPLLRHRCVCCKCHLTCIATTIGALHLNCALGNDLSIAVSTHIHITHPYHLMLMPGTVSSVNDLFCFIYPRSCTSPNICCVCPTYMYMCPLPAGPACSVLQSVTHNCQNRTSISVCDNLPLQHAVAARFGERGAPGDVPAMSLAHSGRMYVARCPKHLASVPL